MPPPMPPEKVPIAKKAMAHFDRETNMVAAFAAGDSVRTKAFGARGHARLPQYARGRRGRIEAFRGFHVLPDTNLTGDGPAEPLYTVSFAAADLWLEATGRKDRVYLDLWESYLERD
jgi:nitrile hydratase